MKAWRSRLSAIARRKSGLSNGGRLRLMMMWRLTPPAGATSQIAFGVWARMFFTVSGDKVPGKDMSSLPATKASADVAGSATIWYSIPSR